MAEGSAPGQAAELPRVSIVIPVYNGADFLDQAIRSALAQTYGNLEVVVVNDGSTDGGETERIARSWGERIRYVSKPNGGVATALNAGIEAMTGEYFSWLSHDDLYHPDKVAAQVQHLLALGTPDAVVYSDFEEIDAQGRLLPRREIPACGDAILAVFATVLHGCTLLVPRRAFQAAGGFNPALRTTQDNEMWLRIALAGFPFHHLPRVLVQSRQHPGQGSRTIDTHLDEREGWYRWAVDAIGPAARARLAPDIAAILMEKECPSVFRLLVRRLREDGHPVDGLRRVFLRRLPGLLRRRGVRALRGVPGAVWLKRRLGALRPGQAPA